MNDADRPSTRNELLRLGLVVAVFGISGWIAYQFLAEVGFVVALIPTAIAIKVADL